MRLVTFLCFLILTSGLLQASPNQYKSGQNFIVSEADTLAGDLFYGGRYLEIEGQANGDVVAGAQKVLLSGNVNDDVYAWAEEVRVEGTVGDMLLGFAKEITVRGRVEGDVIAYGGMVHILKDAEIMGDLYVGTGYFLLDGGTVHGNIKGGAKEVVLNGKVDGDFSLHANEVRFGDQFRSDGKAHLVLGEEPEQALKNAPANLQIDVEPVRMFFARLGFWWMFISALVIGFILLALFPGLFEDLTALVAKKSLTIAGSGALFLILTPVAAVFAILVLPLSLILVALYAIILYLSKIFIAYAAGSLVLKRLQPARQTSRYLEFVLGLILITLVTRIPAVGGLVSFLVILAGSGAFIYHLMRAIKARKAAVVEAS